jgi:hypothetical protein
MYPNGTYFPPQIKSQIDRLGVTVKIFEWNNEIQDPPSSELIDGNKNEYPLWGRDLRNTKRSNWFRLLLLYKYGGV